MPAPLDIQRSSRPSSAFSTPLLQQYPSLTSTYDSTPRTMPTPPVQSAYPSPPSCPTQPIDDPKDNSNNPWTVDVEEDGASTSLLKVASPLTSALFSPTPSLPSPSPSHYLDDDDGNDYLFAYDRFDPDYGSFRVQSPSMGGGGYSHQQHRDLESAFCRNFSCCGLNLRDLHDLLQHYEECHVRFEDDEDDDSLSGSGEDGSGSSSSPPSSSHGHATAPLMMGQHQYHHSHQHPPRYHRLTAISGTRSGGLLDSASGIGIGIQFGTTTDALYDDDDSWSESDSDPTTSPTSSSLSPSLSSSMTMNGGADSPSLAAVFQGPRSSLRLPFLTSPRDHYGSTTHVLELAAVGFGHSSSLKRKAGVSLSDIYAEDNLDNHLHPHFLHGTDATFANTIFRLRANNNHAQPTSLFSPSSASSSMEHLSSVILKKQALENSQRANTAAALLAQGHIHGGSDANGMPGHAPVPQQQPSNSYRPLQTNGQQQHPPLPLGHPQHPQTHPLARSHHPPLVPSLPITHGENPHLPHGTTPSVLMTSTAAANRHSMIPGPLQTSLHYNHHPFPPGMTTAEMLRQRDEAFSLIEDMSRNPGACAQGDKPYRCAVLGCDKAYKNPNGLKYHNQHGHCSSLGMCDTDAPGSKPYICTFLECGKRYKNLNGLKYHIEHSHPNLTAALRAHQSGLMNNLLLYSPYPNQAAMTIAAALAAVQASPMMMAAANAILTAAANNNNYNNTHANSNGGHGVAKNGGNNNSSSGNGNGACISNASGPLSAAPSSSATTAPVTPVSAVPPASAMFTPSTNAPAPARASAPAPAPAAKATMTPFPPLPPPLSATLNNLDGSSLPAVPILTGMVPMVHVSSAPISAIPPIEPPSPPMATAATAAMAVTDEAEDMEVDIEGDAASMLTSINHTVNKDRMEQPESRVVGGARSLYETMTMDDEGETESKQEGSMTSVVNAIATTRTTPTLVPSAAAASATTTTTTITTKKPRGNKQIAVTSETRLPLPLSATETLANETRDNLSFKQNNSLLLDHTTKKGNDANGDRPTTPANASSCKARSGATAKASKVSCTATTATTATTITTTAVSLENNWTATTRSSTSELATAKSSPSSSPTTASSKTMMTRSTRHQQHQDDKEKEKETQPSPPITRKSRK